MSNVSFEVLSDMAIDSRYPRAPNDKGMPSNTKRPYTDLYDPVWSFKSNNSIPVTRYLYALIIDVISVLRDTNIL